jgi:hypothetical protein
MTFFVQGAAVDAGEHQFVAAGLVEIHVRLHQSEGTRNLVYDAVDKLIEIKEGTDSVRGFLEPEQILSQIGRRRWRQRGDLFSQHWDRSHRAPFGRQLWSSKF